MPFQPKKTMNAIVAAAAVAFAAHAHAQHKDIVDTAVSAGSFETLAAALDAAGLIDTLKGKGPFTVFAPTDEAFAKLPSGAVASLLKPKNRDQLTAVLTYHVTAGRLKASKLAQMRDVATVNGQRLGLRAAGDGLEVGGANVLSTVAASNGIIHVIDAVLMPATGDLVDTAKSAGNFGTLLAAAKAAGLVETLRGDGPFTVLAPTDDAFAKLPSATLQSLLQPQNKDILASILKYHVIPGRVFGREALSAGQAASVYGASVDFEIRDGRLRAGGAAVVANDIQASNGVIHVIDSVLLPDDLPDLRPAGRLVVGVTIGRASSEQRSAVGLGDGEGIVVGTVTDGAKAAGLERGDLIISVDGMPATSANLRRAKEKAGAGGTVEILFARRVPVEVRVDPH